jgi:hypothetical protein
MRLGNNLFALSASQFSFQCCGAKLVDSTVASIFALLFRRSPSKIAGLIISVVVRVAIESVTGWTFTNICKKIFKFKPAFADFDATTTVIFKRCSVWITTARQHLSPRMIKRVSFSGSRKAVTITSCSTATRFSFAITKSRRSGSVQLAADTSAKPQQFSTAFSRSAVWLNCSQVAKFLACDINPFGHRTVAPVRGSSGEVALRALPRCAL